ncbi:FAD-dependent oxidoreductase, partial [Fulvivirgaceae bacterium PWU4]
AFPWGAHYLPLPGTNDAELTAFLTEAGVITGVTNGLPVFNEYYLCHDPKERLYIHHHWQEGIIPHEGVPPKDREEIERFLAMMHGYKELKGSDGREAFAIPVSFSSADEKILALDAITAEQFLADNNFTSTYLRWYVNYCCADDYGTSVAQTSAWAMVHYFASRKGKALNAASDSVLTWPEGNYWLIKQLRKNLQTNIQPQSLAYSVNLKGNGVEVLYFDATRNMSKKIEANAVIMATPQFINQRLLAGTQRNLDYQTFEYAPWMVANITTDLPLNERRGEQLCWDNVIYGSEALGYVNALHQQVGIYQHEKVITYYKPLLGSDPRAARQQAYTHTFDDWKAAILADLQKPHPGMEKNIQEMNVWLWGHGMIKPSPGFIWSANRKNAATPLNDRIHFAHADLSGISIFEEAFYNGHQSARAVLKHDA